MKTTILIKKGRVQLVLKPENDHDKEVFKILEKLPHTFRGDFFETKAGYTRGINSSINAYGERKDDEDLIIVFDEKKEFEGIDISEEVEKARQNKTSIAFYRGDLERGVFGDPIVEYDFREIDVH